MPTEQAPSPQIRAALDLGSSHHKLTIAEYIPNAIPKILHEAQIRVPLSDNLSANNDLPPSILNLSKNAVHTLLHLVHSYKATQIATIATQVFRVARNGPAHLASLSAIHNLSPVLLSPAEEGALAFQTALSLSSRHLPPNASPVVWDSGGASTQWTVAQDPYSIEQTRYIVHPIPLGSRDARAAMRRVVASKDTLSAPSILAALKAFVHTVMPRPPPWLLRCVHAEHAVVLGIGGSTSMFSLAAEAIGNSNVFSAAEVWGVVEGVLENGVRDSDLFWSVLPKLVFLGELMDICGMGTVRYVNANGSCIGLLASTDDRFWSKEMPLRRVPGLDVLVVQSVRREERLRVDHIQSSSAATSC